MSKAKYPNLEQGNLETVNRTYFNTVAKKKNIETEMDFHPWALRGKGCLLANVSENKVQLQQRPQKQWGGGEGGRQSSIFFRDNHPER